MLSFARIQHIITRNCPPFPENLHTKLNPSDQLDNLTPHHKQSSPMCRGSKDFENLKAVDKLSKAI